MPRTPFQGHWVKPAVGVGCHDVGAATGVWRVEARDVPEHPAWHRMAPQQRALQHPTPVVPVCREFWSVVLNK